MNLIVIIEKPGQGARILGSGSLEGCKTLIRNEAGQEVTEYKELNEHSLTAFWVVGNDTVYSIHELPN